MFFLLRVAFWMTIVLALLPTGSSRPVATSVQIDAADAVAAAGAAVSDVTGFCDREPKACTVGAQAAAAIGQRAQAGARMVYDFLHDQIARGETGSVPAARSAGRSAPHQAESQTTLRAEDLEPGWRGPADRTEPVPLPRPRPTGRQRV
jgi:hypothetical protein